MTVKKVLLSIISIMFSVNLLCCGLLRDKMVNERLNILNENSKTNEKFSNEILTVLQNKDKEVLKQMF